MIKTAKRFSFLFLATTLFCGQLAYAEADNAATQEKAAMCIACHGATGESIIPGTPHLGGQYQDYLAKALEDYRSGARQNPVMNGMAAALSDEDIAILASYYANQAGLAVVNAK